MEVLNETLYKFSSQLIIQEKHLDKHPASFEDHFGQINMNRIIEAAKFEPETTFEKNMSSLNLERTTQLQIR